MSEVKKNYDGPIESLESLQEEESSFNFKNMLSIFILNWKWFLLSMFIFVCGALIYLRYTDSVYQVTAKMLIKEETSNRRYNGSALASMQNLGMMTNSTGIENEMEILKSRRLSLEAINDLKLYVEYRTEGRIKKVLLYKTQPINVDLDPQSLERMNSEGPSSFGFIISRSSEGYRVVSDDMTALPFEGTFSTMPDTLTTPYGVLTFTLNISKGMRPLASGQNLLVSITAPKLVAQRYAKILQVEPTSKMTSIAQLIIRDLNVERGYDYLNQLAVCYNRQANADKNEIALKTEEFINARLEKINNELGMTESELEEFKRSNRLTELRLDANQTLTQSSQYAAKLADANTQIMLLDYLREHVNDPANKYQIIPSNVGMTDPISASLINEYNKTVQDRDKLLRSASESAPQVITLTNTLDNLTASIKTALMQARRTADIQRQSIESQYSNYSQRISNTPEQERILTQIGRQQEVKSGLYLMLLQKREENSISLAATADKGWLIDEPAYAGKVSPKNSIIMLAAILLGFMLPMLIFYLIQILRYKIEGRNDVERLTSLPIVVDVPVASESAKSAAGIVVKENENNQIDEVFRSLRTNIQFMMTNEQKVILFTSSTSGEGKTFNAANLAVSFALLGKKVILMGLDIRKPALGRLFNIEDRDSGVTPLLAMNSVTMSDLRQQINPSGVNANLDLMLAGPIPPNPTELLARQNLGDIIALLKEHYDYIILDTAPVGLVTDTLQIAKHADVTAFVCRADYTPKSSFQMLNQLNEEKKLPNICVVLNGVDMSKKKYGYYYGYGRYGRYGGRYGNYGSSYGYYAESSYGNKNDDSVKRKKKQ